jgi:hypothetical protein
MGKNLTSANSGSKPTKGNSVTKDVKLPLLTAAVSATIRMAAPTFGLFMIGLAVDFSLQQTAFYAIVGAGIGFVIAAFLIYLQVKKLKLQGQDSLINDHDGVIKPKTVKHTREKK